MPKTLVFNESANVWIWAEGENAVTPFPNTNDDPAVYSNGEYVF